MPFHGAGGVHGFGGLRFATLLGGFRFPAQEFVHVLADERRFEPVEELRGRISLVVMLAFGLDNWGQGLLSFLWKGDEWTTISL